MSNINLRSKNIIYCVFGLIFFCPCAGHATVSLPAPDNAALLYYQAMLLRPELDLETFIPFDGVLRGDDPDEIVREYLNLTDTRETIRLAEAATKIPQCSWGIIPSQGRYYLTLMELIGQVRQIAFLLEVDARTLAIDGEYLVALDRCLSMRRLARHIADEATVVYLVSMPLDFRALHCIHYVLGLIQADKNILIWLQAQISTVQGPPPLPGMSLEIALDDALKFLCMHPELLATWRENVSELVEDESAKQEILSLTDEELLDQAKDSYNKFLSSVNRVIGSDIPYQQKYLELQELEEELENHPIDDPVGILSLLILSNVVEQHDIYVRGITVFNATRAAIEIYLIKAETGQLPETLPSNLPKDPFGGQDFGYDVTDKGFTISFDPEDIGDLRVRQFEFIVVQ